MCRVQQHEAAVGPVEDGDFTFTIENVVDHVVREDRDTAAMGPLLVVDVNLVLDAELGTASGAGQPDHPTEGGQDEGHGEKTQGELAGHGISFPQVGVEENGQGPRRRRIGDRAVSVKRRMVPRGAVRRTAIVLDAPRRRC